MVQIIGQEGLGDLLGRSTGQGFSQGVSSGLDYLTQQKLQQMVSQRKGHEQQQKEYAPFTHDEIPKSLISQGIDKDKLMTLNLNDYDEMLRSANEKIQQGVPRSVALNTTAREFFGYTQPETGLEMMQSEKAEKEGMLSKLTSSGVLGALPSLLGYGIKKSPELSEIVAKGGESGIAGQQGAALRGEGYESFKKRTKLDAPNWWKNALYGMSKLAADAPYYAAGGKLGAIGGGTVGGPLGATVGGGAGALALPAMIETGLTEYLKYLDKGGKGSFGDFVESTGKVLESGTQGALEGAILAPLSKLKFLQNIPGLKNILKIKGGKAAEKLIDSGARAGVFTSSLGLSRGEFPSAEEYGSNIAMFLGIDLMHAAGKYKTNIYRNLKKAGIPPQEAAQRIQETVQEKGYDLESPKDIVRVVRDITKEPSKVSDIAQKTITEVGIEKVKAEKEPGTAELAERISERPLEKYLEKEEKVEKAKEKAAAKGKEYKEKELTVKEKAKREQAGKEADQLVPKLEKIQDDISYLEERKQGNQTKEQKQLTDIALESKRKELDKIRTEYENKRGIEKSGVEPFREKDLNPAIEKHMREVEAAAADPESTNAKELKKMFERDQKYIDQELALAEKGKIPEAGYIDRWIKILDAYNKAYDTALRNAKKTLESSNLPKEFRKNLEKFVDLMETNQKINRAKVKNQKDKLATRKQLKGPKGALVKQVLKDLRKDIKSIQNDFVKQIKHYNEITKRIESAANRKLLEKKPDIQKSKLTAKEVKESSKPPEIPEKKITEEAKKSKIDESKLKKSWEKIKNEWPNVIEKFKERPDKGIMEFRKLTRYLPFSYQLALGSLISFALENTPGISNKVGRLMAFTALPANTTIRVLSQVVGGMITDEYKDYLINNAATNLIEKRQKSVKDAVDFQTKLKSKMSAKEYNKVIEKYKELTTR